MAITSGSVGLGEGALAGNFPRPVDVTDHPDVSRSIHQSSGVCVGRERAREQIIETERAQGFNTCFSY
jgi:hypothetical protein